MCGIFGSNVFKNFERIYIENKRRGIYSFGSLYTAANKEIYVSKNKGTRALTGDYAFSGDFKWFLGHTQAPTSRQREFSPRTTHPFEDMYHIVAHNGVLENHEQIESDYLINHMNPVDSSVIPALIGMLFDFDDDVMSIESNLEIHKTGEMLAIEKTFALLKGTFACWVYSKLTGCIYLVRSGSTLFGNLETGEFSSVKVRGLVDVELKEGVIYCVTDEGLAECGNFETSSPFFL